MRTLDGTELRARAVVIATGIDWRRLAVPRVEQLVGACFVDPQTLGELAQRLVLLVGDRVVREGDRGRKDEGNLAAGGVLVQLGDDVAQAGVAAVAPMVRIAGSRGLGIPDMLLGVAEDYLALRAGTEALGMTMDQRGDARCRAVFFCAPADAGALRFSPTADWFSCFVAAQCASPWGPNKLILKGLVIHNPAPPA